MPNPYFEHKAFICCRACLRENKVQMTPDEMIVRTAEGCVSCLDAWTTNCANMSLYDKENEDLNNFTNLRTCKQFGPDMFTGQFSFLAQYFNCAWNPADEQIPRHAEYNKARRELKEASGSQQTGLRIQQSDFIVMRSTRGMMGLPDMADASEDTNDIKNNKGQLEAKTLVLGNDPGYQEWVKDRKMGTKKWQCQFYGVFSVYYEMVFISIWLMMIQDSSLVAFSTNRNTIMNGRKDLGGYPNCRWNDVDRVYCRRVLDPTEWWWFQVVGWNCLLTALSFPYISQINRMAYLQGGTGDLPVNAYCSWFFKEGGNDAPVPTFGQLGVDKVDYTGDPCYRVHTAPVIKNICQMSPSCAKWCLVYQNPINKLFIPCFLNLFTSVMVSVTTFIGELQEGPQNYTPEPWKSEVDGYKKVNKPPGWHFSWGVPLDDSSSDEADDPDGSKGIQKAIMKVMRSVETGHGADMSDDEKKKYFAMAGVKALSLNVDWEVEQILDKEWVDCCCWNHILIAGPSRRTYCCCCRRYQVPMGVMNRFKKDGQNDPPWNIFQWAYMNMVFQFYVLGLVLDPMEDYERVREVLDARTIAGTLEAKVPVAVVDAWFLLLWKYALSRIAITP